MQPDYFLTQLGRQWKWVVLRGAVAIVLGLLALVMPRQTLEVVTLCWGVYALVDGLLALVTAYQVREHNRPWWSLAAVGVVSVVAGLATFAWPTVTTLTLLELIGIWAIFMGLLQVVTAVRLRRSMHGEPMMVLSGALSVLFGLGMVAAPIAGALALVWLVGCYAIAFGALVVSVGLRLRGVAKRPWEPPQATRPAVLATRPAPLSSPGIDH